MGSVKDNGGARKGAGRPTRAAEEHALSVIKKALRVIYKKNNDDEAKIEFLKEFSVSQRGQQFIAEHLFGKPRDIVENINYNVGEITEEEAKKINNALEGDY